MSQKFLKTVIICSFVCNIVMSHPELDCSYEGYTALQKRQLETPNDYVQGWYILGGSLAMMANIFIISIFVVFPKTRKPPADMIILICFCDLLISLHFLISGLYLVINKIAPDTNSAFCNITGAIQIVGVMGVLLFSMGFAFFPIIKINFTLKGKWRLFSIYVTVSTTLLIIGLITFALLTDQVNLTMNGDCYFQATTNFQNSIDSYVQLWFILCFTAVGSYSIFRLRGSMPKNAQNIQKRRYYINYFKTFFIYTMTTALLEELFESLVYANCYYFHNGPLNTFLLSTGDFLYILDPIVKPTIFAFDPLIRTTVLLIFQQKRISRSFGNLTDSLLENEDNIFAELTNQMRSSQISSILAGILLMRKNQLDKTADQKIDDEVIIQRNSSMDYEELNRQTFIRDQKYKEEDVNTIEEIRMDDFLVKDCLQLQQETEMSFLDMKVVLHSPKVYQYFIECDKSIVNIEKSLDLVLNKDRISSVAGPDGGKSGEFFFFSYDNMLILKTLTSEEFQAIKKRTIVHLPFQNNKQYYANYLFYNESSFISKFYGIYTFQRISTSFTAFPKTYILLMRNISLGVPRKFITRTFDMKGSEFDREVLGKKPNQDPQMLTLKDIDFFKTEDKIWIDKQQSSIIVAALSDDAKFFKNTKLIDYSLLVFKVNWALYEEETRISAESMLERLSNPFYMIKSEKEEGVLYIQIKLYLYQQVYYQIGIIDYLQEWNANKGMEQATKKIIRFDSKLDTSAQNPQVYADRFVKKLVQRIFEQDT